MSNLEYNDYDNPGTSNSSSPEKSFEACTHPGNVDPEQQPKPEPIQITIQTDEFTLEEDDPNDSCFKYCPKVHEKLRLIVSVDNDDEIRNLVQWVNLLRSDCPGPSLDDQDTSQWHCLSILAPTYED